jgi:carotenoid cleavage dioxygenase
MSAPSGLIERAAGWISRRARDRVPYDEHNIFLEGPFAPVATEVTEIALRVSGKIPPELNGLYARIGPNPIHIKNPANYHWFLGDGMVHGVRLREGQAVWYRNRWIGTDEVNRHFGKPPAPGLRNSSIDTVNTNVIGHAGKIWALVEAGPLPVQLDSDLNTQKHGFFETPLQRSFSAHPHRDPSTGELHAVCYDVMVQNFVFYVVIGADGQVVRDVKVPVQHGPMVHDCAITPSYAIILDLPITFSMGAVLRGHAFPYQWNEKHPARIGLLPRQGTGDDVVWFDIDPCFAFHCANAFDQPDGSVVLDLITYPKLFDGTRQGPVGSASTFERFTLSPAEGRVKRDVVSTFLQEFPRCDERLLGQPYRYAYTVGIDVHAPGPEKLYRHDMRSGTIVTQDFGGHHMPGEVVFVPRQEGEAEDDGWLLSYVYDLRDATSALTILDASDVSGAPVATVHLPARVPLGFHGNWIKESLLF